MVGPWHTYADGLFSVNEPRDEHFEEFTLSADFRRELEQRGGGSLMAATHAGIFMLSPDTLRVRSVFDAAGRAGRLLETGAGLAMIDQWSESLLLRQSGRWRPLGEQVSDAICLTARDT